MENELKMIGHRIKCLRMESNVSQSSMANKIESGRTTATIPVLFKIQKVLGCKMADFFVDFDGKVEKTALKEEQGVKQSLELEDVINILKLLKAVEIKGL